MAAGERQGLHGSQSDPEKAQRLYEGSKCTGVSVLICVCVREGAGNTGSALYCTVYKHNLARGSGRNVFFFVPKRIRWSEMECGAGDKIEPLYSLYHSVHVVSIKWLVALAQQKPVHTSQDVIYDDRAIN